MALDGKLLIKAKAALEEKRRLNADLYLRRRLEVYHKAPGVRALDNELRATMLELVSISFGDNDVDKVGDIRVKNLELQEERLAEIRRVGYPVDYLDEKYLCSKCNDTGYVRTEVCDCLMELYKIEQTLALSNLFKLGDETFDNFDLSYYDDTPSIDTGISPRKAMEMIYEICIEYSRKFGDKSMNLFFIGSPGLGKTYLSACIARVVAGKGFSVVYDTASSIFSKFEDEQFGRGDDPEDISEMRSEIKRYLECDLLILDDLGTEFITKLTISALYELINTRLITNKKTIVSSNLTMDDLGKCYTEQILSRLEGEYQVLKFRGEDIRKKKKMM